MKPTRLVAAAAALALAAAGCTDPGRDPVPPAQPTTATASTPQATPGRSRTTEDALIAAARTLPDAPERVTVTTGAVDCGRLVLGQGGVVAASAITCLTSGDAARDHVLAVSMPTTEGDPIVNFYRQTAGSRIIDVDISTHRDNVGPKQWYHHTCAADDVTDTATLLGCGAS